MPQRSVHWVNSPVLLEALNRYEQGLLPRSMQLWLQALLEIEPITPAAQAVLLRPEPLRPH